MYSVFNKKNFYGFDKKKNYFEGWYLKHENKNDSISFIPSYHISKEGNKSISLQIVMNETAYQVSYKKTEFYAAEKVFYCQVGANRFSNKGIIIDINTDQLKVYGKIEYGELNTLKGDIMGPFQWLPWMECRHEIISIGHKLKGTLTVNGKKLDFNRGIGYIEKDRGSSFPEGYFWTQCNWLEKGLQSIFFSTARIPYAKLYFDGIICMIRYGGKQYCIATYKGAKVLMATDKEVCVKQGCYRFQITVLEFNAVSLQAPSKGIMGREISEGLRCKVRYRLWKKDSLLMDVVRENASIESQLCKR